MDIIKKTGILGGAVIGGVVGGTLSVVGKVSKVKIIDDIGSSIVDSTLLTGAIAGDIASGTTDVVAGNIKKNPEQVQEGVSDLKSGGNRIVGNFVNNFHLTIENGSEVAQGIKNKDLHQTVKGAKTFVKMAAVGLITVGAIKLTDSDKSDADDPITEEESGKTDNKV